MANSPADLFVELVASTHWLAEIETFLAQGGTVLTVIMLVTFALLYLILERGLYLWRRVQRDSGALLYCWQQRQDHHSWYAHQIRTRLISLLRTKAQANLNTIKALVSIAPLLGLLGTVTGMIAVFDVMAITGGGNTRAMAAGVSQATIPTMAGMVVALLGLLCGASLQRQSQRQVDALAVNLELQHSNSQELESSRDLGGATTSVVVP